MWIPVVVLIIEVLLLTDVDSNPVWSNGTEQEAKAKEICMKDLGCFAITEDFKSVKNRPINVLPHDRATINTKCMLYTKRNLKESHQLVASDKRTFDQSKFDPKDPTIFIIHGFMDRDLYGPWMSDLKDEFLMLREYNVIVVDWSGGNKAPYYQASSNARVVGAEIALMVQTLEKYKGISRKSVHIVGHSLGAHIAGYAGERLKTLGRITGCDPAAPYFQNMPISVRLDPTDAEFVDVIHSDAVDVMLIGLGMTQKVGHVDFFPNNGRNQPGCKKDRFTSFITDGLTEGGRRFVACNHQRSLDFLHYSINRNKGIPVGFKCASWQEFLDGKCADCGSDNKRCAILGLRAIEYKKYMGSSVQQAMYLQTSGTKPFFLYHYQVNIKLFKPKTAPKDCKGILTVTLFGSKADELFKLQTLRGIDLVHGSRNQFLVTTDKELGQLKSVSLKWTSTSMNPITLMKKPSIYVEYISVIPLNAVESSPRNMTNRVFCGTPSRGIEPRTVANFNRDNKCLKFL